MHIPTKTCIFCQQQWIVVHSVKKGALLKVFSNNIKLIMTSNVWSWLTLWVVILSESFEKEFGIYADIKNTDRCIKQKLWCPTFMWKQSFVVTSKGTGIEKELFNYFFLNIDLGPGEKNIPMNDPHTLSCLHFPVT